MIEPTFKNKFLAVYFADIENIPRLIREKNDLIFNIPIPEGRDHWGNDQKVVALSAMELLQMNLDSWFGIKDREALEHYQEINPKRIYNDSLKSIAWIEDHFGIKNSGKVAYEKYISFMYSLVGEGWDWIDEDEMIEFQKEGYRKIDLDLINVGVKRDRENVIRLLQEGANLYIDPDDKISESELLEVLMGASSFNSIFQLGYHKQFINSGYVGFKENEFYLMMETLYGVASSDEMIRITKHFK